MLDENDGVGVGSTVMGIELMESLGVKKLGSGVQGVQDSLIVGVAHSLSSDFCCATRLRAVPRVLVFPLINVYMHPIAAGKHDLEVQLGIEGKGLGFGCKIFGFGRCRLALSQGSIP